MIHLTTVHLPQNLIGACNHGIYESGKESENRYCNETSFEKIWLKGILECTQSFKYFREY